VREGERGLAVREMVIILVAALLFSPACVWAQQTLGRWEHLEDDLQRKLAAEGKGGGFSGTSDSAFGGIGDTVTSGVDTVTQGEGLMFGAGRGVQ